MFTFSGGVYAVEAKGGTGKTFCISTIISKLRGMGKIVLAMAVSAQAATLFHGGRTAHSKLKIPIELDDTKLCNFKEKSVTAKLIKEATLLIIGEYGSHENDKYLGRQLYYRSIIHRSSITWIG